MDTQTEPSVTPETPTPQVTSFPSPDESLNRNGKIARLPRLIREVLNLRLSNGDTGRELVAWLNTLPGVQIVLTRYFNGVPISESNMSHWKQGGYRDWLRTQEARQRALHFAERAHAITVGLQHGEADDTSLGTTSESLGVLLSAEVAREVETTLAETTDRKERWAALKDMLQLVGRLRRDDQRAAWLKLAQERLNREHPPEHRGPNGHPEIDDLAEDMKMHAKRVLMWGAALAGTFEEFRAGQLAYRAAEADPFGQKSRPVAPNGTKLK